ncbi:MAG: hypothetical protein ACOYJ1_16580, partial [Peptococcales bacterium]
YLQFFLGLPAFQHEAPFDASAMTLFRKRIPVDLLADLNDFIAGRRNPYAEDGNTNGDSSGNTPPSVLYQLPVRQCSQGRGSQCHHL